MRKFLVRNEIAQDVREFVFSCLHCLASEGYVVKRPLGQALHSIVPNGVIHFDYLFVTKSKDDCVYILLLKDDLSGYVWLVPTKAADAETTALELSIWFAAFGVVPVWVSDQGSHFKNAVGSQLRDDLC